MEYLPEQIKAILKKQNRDWSDFGLLWEWSKKQDWWVDFEESTLYSGGATHYGGWFDTDFINPDRFADAVYDYLKKINLDKK